MPLIVILNTSTCSTIQWIHIVAIIVVVLVLLMKYLFCNTEYDNRCCVIVFFAVANNKHLCNSE